MLALLDEMYGYYKTQVVKYREFFPKNKPSGALENTILMMRLIAKNALFKESHPELPVSFTQELKRIMSQAADERYERNLELSLPLDESDLEAVMDGLRALVDLVCDEIEADGKYFHQPFVK